MEKLEDQVGKKTGDKCPSCGSDMIYTDGLGLYSYPPCTRIHCKKCKHMDFKSYCPAGEDLNTGIVDPDLIRGLPVFKDGGSW